MEYWHTLAYSNIGTHKMRFRKMMIKPDAIMLGKAECEKSNLTYVGTYSSDEINKAEEKLRSELYA